MEALVDADERLPELLDDDGMTPCLVVSISLVQFPVGSDGPFLCFLEVSELESLLQTMITKITLGRVISQSYPAIFQRQFLFISLDLNLLRPSAKESIQLKKLTLIDYYLIV